MQEFKRLMGRKFETLKALSPLGINAMKEEFIPAINLPFLEKLLIIKT